MLRDRLWLAAPLIVLGLGVAGPGRSAVGSGITDGWSGASAIAGFNATTDAKQGATASARAGGSNSILIQAGFSNYTFNVKTSGEFGASASADPAHLLRVNASYHATGAGVSYQVMGPSDSASVKAAWTNDAAIVSAPAGSGLPDAIRLNFTLTFDAPGTIPYSRLTATANGQTDKIDYREIAFSHGFEGSPDSITLDSSDPITGRPAYGTPTRMTDTFHVDLPLDKSGRSGPINLELALDPPVGVIRTPGGGAYGYDGMVGNLALSSVTLPDGMGLDSIGASVVFDSGLAYPNAVPEPSALSLWALTSLGGLCVWTRRRATR